jgi:hypothetical protein
MPDHLLAVRFDLQCPGNPPNVLPDLRQRIRLQRDDFGISFHAARHRLFHVAQADGADLALDLGEDVGRLQSFDGLLENLVDGHRGARRFLDRSVDFPDAGIHGNSRSRADRQGPHGLRIVALVGASYQVFQLSERVHDLGGAGD